MSLGHYLFSFSGRINRAKQWAGLLVGLAFGVLIQVLFAVTGGWAAVGDLVDAKIKFAQFIASQQMQTFLILACALYAAVLYTTFAIAAKRLHDRDKSAWWLLVFIVLPFVLNIPGFMMLPQYMHMMEQAVQAAQNHLPPPQPPQNPLATIANGAATIISLWAFVELYCLRGTIGDNRYGPDPIPGKPALASATTCSAFPDGSIAPSTGGPYWWAWASCWRASPSPCPISSSSIPRPRPPTHP